MKVNVPLAVTSRTIFDLFNQLSRQYGFEVIENDQHFATSVHRGDSSYSISKIFKGCIPFQAVGQTGDHQELVDDVSFEGQRASIAQQQPTLTAIRMSLSVDEIKCCRKVTIKKVYGNHLQPVRDMIQAFKKKLNEVVVQLPGAQNQEFLNDETQETEMSSFRENTFTTRT